MFEDMKFPLFFFEDHDLYISDSIEEAESFFEPFLKEDEITGFDSEGRKILFKRQEAKSIRDERFLFHSIDESPTHKDEFIIALKMCLSNFDLQGVLYTNKSLDDLVSLTIEYYQKPKSFQEKIVHYFQIGAFIIFIAVLCGLIGYLFVIIEDF